MVRIKSVLDILAYGIALLGFVPLVAYLDMIPRFLFPAVLLFAVVADRRDTILRGHLPTVISLLFFVYFGIQFSRDNLVGPAVNLLVVLLAVRLASEKGSRHYLQIYALALFALAGSSLLNLSAAFLVYLLLLLVLIAVSLVLLTFYDRDGDTAIARDGMMKVVTVAASMPLAAMPLILLFFVILPRTQFPLWNVLNVASGAATGLSDKVQPGTAPAVAEVKNVVFRADSQPLTKNQLYWRGVVLNTLEGGSWVRKPVPGAEWSVPGAGRGVSQTIFPEPGKSRYLLALNVPRDLTGVRFATAPDIVHTIIPSGRRLRYETQSVPGAVIRTSRGIDRTFYLQLPPGLSPRLVSLGRQMAQRGKTDTDRLALLERYFVDRKLRYATKDLPTGSDPLAQFLLDGKPGHCEFFASTLAVLLRAADVPARLVGGYYGGDYNAVGGYYVVTEERAHVWVEAYLDGKGWVTVDPSAWAVNFAGVGGAEEQGFTRRVRMYLDSFSYFWNLTVINYDLERQISILNRANTGLRRLSFPSHLSLRLLLIPVVLLLAALVVWRVCVWQKVGREERLLKILFTLVRRRYGVEWPPDKGLHELARTLDEPRITRFVQMYGDVVYHDRKLSRDEYIRLRSLLAELRAAPH
ncbi:transglutaminaseTgpA domain-containing protein [Geomobilimonas luticola]|uniref:Transglutaminase-like domain-containing protein n=1 Tax=Geomobilimonas luticola TaxID=1114878 RepID=A0ABS5SC05_9BACT|nr:DUF3488 and transglutaminase-like domain-containing protein [Geomobilimonas luticola]MBT0652894.1 transglutaminase-like domain-containing protein [Geomobilimonas luticola]